MNVSTTAVRTVFNIAATLCMVLLMGYAQTLAQDRLQGSMLQQHPLTPAQIALLQANIPLVPVPTSITLGEGRFRFTTTQTVSVLGNPDKRLYPNATRLLRRLGDRTNIRFPQDHVLPQDTMRDTARDAAFVLECKRPARLELGEDESYTLSITPTQVKISAETDIGVLRGIETLLQTLQADTAYYFPALIAIDRPRFLWRGLMLDVCRHFFDVQHVKRLLDQMALVKLNVLHLHLSDDQGFRVECKTFPKLHEMGSDGMYYTQEEIKNVIRYAAERGIRVVPEFDMPGHSTAWFVGHPELGSGTPPYTIERRWGTDAAPMNPIKDTTYAFLDRFIKEMAALFPDQYFHIGGDEVRGKAWRENKEIQDYMKANGITTKSELQQMFNKRLRPIVQKYGKIMVGWDEIFEHELPKDIVIHTWQRKDTLYRTVRKGHRGLLSWGYYIDLIRPASAHYAVDPLPSDTLLTPEEAKRILGGEATMWSEYVVTETVDSRIWPRTAAIAERFWSDREVKNVDDMYRRLDHISLRLEELGSMHEKNYEMLLRQILGSTQREDVQTLRTLVDVIEPVKEYQRGRYGFSTLMGFTDVVDAARPDAMVARRFTQAAERWLVASTHPTLSLLLDSLPETHLLRTELRRWQANHPAFVQLVQKSPKLRPAEELSRLLAECSALGLQAMAYLMEKPTTQTEKPAKKLQKNQQAQAAQAQERETAARLAWYERAKPILLAAKKPYAKCELQVVQALESLVQRVTQATVSVGLPTNSQRK